MRKTELMDLMQREIDGENSEKETTRLKRYLGKNPEAKQEFDELIFLSQSLLNVPQAVPPRNLKPMIFNALQLGDRSAPHIEKERSWFRSLLPSAQPLKYVYTFSFGLVAGMFLFLVLSANEGAPVQPDDLRGTLLSDQEFQALQPGGSVPLTLTSGFATVSTRYSPMIGVVQIDVTSTHDLQLELQYDKTLSFQAFRQTGGAEQTLSTAPGKINVTNVVGGRLMFIFEKKIETSEPIQLSLYQQEERLHQLALSLSGSSNMPE